MVDTSIFANDEVWESVFNAVNEAIAAEKLTVLQKNGVEQGQQL